jgi:hypothetical protein
MKAPFGWTVIRRPNLFKPKGCVFLVYKRDCPADARHLAADLAPFTHTSKAKAIAAGERGEYAYKQKAA